MNIRSRTPVTSFLVWTNIILHGLLNLFIYSQGDGPQHEFFKVWGLVPVSFWEGAWWQPGTALFLHAGLFHLVFNMLALWSLGSPIEITLGSKNFAWLYVISGFTSSLFVVVGQHDLAFPTVGASGAVLGLLGALAVFFPSSRLLVLFFPMSARTAAIVFGVGSLLLSIYHSSSGISHVGHLGGLVGGLLYSRFALGLNFGKQSLHAGRRPGSGSPLLYEKPRPSPDRPDPFSGEPVAPESGAEDEIFRVLERLRKSGRKGEGPFSGNIFRREKEINPGRVDDFTGERKVDEKKEPEGSGSDFGGEEKEHRLYYDPITGKFYKK